MSSKFFNNDTGNTLFDKLKGIASGMAKFDRFLAVVGFFRSSGYFKLRKELKDVEESEPYRFQTTCFRSRTRLRKLA